MKFGSDSVDAVRFGSQVVSKVYFGATQVWSGLQTFYFQADITNDWSNLNNWWMDDSYTTQATTLPSSSDHVVVVNGPITENTGAAAAVASMTVNSGNVSINVTVTEGAVFNSDAELYGNLYGNATFNGSSVNYGTVHGNAIFNDSSSSAANSLVTGTAEFYDTSYYGCFAAFLGGITLNFSTAPEPVYGCTSQGATNYNDTATCDDGSCCDPNLYWDVVGCVACDIAEIEWYDSCGNFMYLDTVPSAAVGVDCGSLCE